MFFFIEIYLAIVYIVVLFNMYKAKKNYIASMSINKFLFCLPGTWLTHDLSWSICSDSVKVTF